MSKKNKNMMTTEKFNSWVKRMLCSFDDKEPELLIMIEDFKNFDQHGGSNRFMGTHFEVIVADKKVMIINKKTLQTASIKINRNREIDYSEIFAALWAKYNNRPIPIKIWTLAELKPGTKFKEYGANSAYVYIEKNDYSNFYVVYELDTKEYHSFYNTLVTII